MASETGSARLTDLRKTVSELRTGLAEVMNDLRAVMLEHNELRCRLAEHIGKIEEQEASERKGTWT